MTSPSSTESALCLSVLMPVYNGARHLSAAVDSVLAQTFGAFEFLILDDGSTDATPRILAAYTARDPRIRVITRENRGLVASLNELIAEARAPLLARMDADDICLPDRFAKQVAHLEAHPDIDVLGGQVLYMDEDGRPIFTPRLPCSHESIDADHLKACTSMSHPAIMMRAAIVRAAGGYDPAYRNSEDLDLWLRLAEIGRLANLEQTVLRYRLTTGGASGGNIEEQVQMQRRAAQEAWARRGLPPQVFGDGYWRPFNTTASRHDFLLKWGWQAWRSGHTGTARHFFVKAIRLKPFSGPAWKAALALSIGRQPRQRRRGRKTEPQEARHG